MNKDLVVGIDAGTSVLKAVAFDMNGHQIAVSSVPNQYATDQNGSATQSMMRTWKDCATALCNLANDIPDLASRVAALGVTGQGDGTWLVGKDNQSVGDAWLWLDSRAAPTAERLRRDDAEIKRYSATGTGLTGCQQGPQLAHMLAHDPHTLDQAEVALHCKEWLYLQLTGVRAVDPSEGCLSFGDFRTRLYSEGVIDVFELGRHKRLLPPICDGLKDHHPLTDEAADATGLLAGTPVVLGYMDCVCSAFGAGAYEPGASVGCTILGTTAVHVRSTKTSEVILNEDLKSGYVLVTPIDGVVVQLQTTMAGTLNFDWILGLAAQVAEATGATLDPPALHDLLTTWIAETQPATCLYHPYISEAGERGPFVDQTARASFVGLTANHRFGDLARATAEGLGLAARDCYAAMGGVPDEVRLTGGAAKSDAIREIISATLGTSVRQSVREESGATGAAMIAAVSVGGAPDMENCIKTWVSPTLGKTERADAHLCETYAKTFPDFVATREALRPIWHRLAHSKDTLS